jgi:hypothetical protein
MAKASRTETDVIAPEPAPISEPTSEEDLPIWTADDQEALRSRLSAMAPAKGPHTVLAPLLRHGKELAPGDTCEFPPDEVDHVAELVVAGSLYPGTGHAARRAVRASVKARTIARTGT